MGRPNAARLVTAALLGMDAETITVNGREYTIQPPTIKRICGAGYYLSDFGNEEVLNDIVRKMQHMEDLCKALSWLIQGDEDLSDELMEGTLTEIIGGIDVTIRLMDVRNFTKLSNLARNVKRTVAKQR